ncbi:hypothetical protein [Enterococcus sp. AZ103]|uniref:hypothetical protein n=1 Tax=Enterococcus sp. AZ103 TaxID=2774628 RepID=UPI003F22E6A1
MTYEVISPFVDCETGKEYAIGDEYKNEKTTRLKALSTHENVTRKPLIKKITKPKENGELNHD